MPIGPDDHYDNSTRCDRSTEAYSAQLEADNSWHTGDQNGVFNGCYSFNLSSMADSRSPEGEEPWYQIEDKVSVVFMQAGGGDASIPNLLQSCIHQEVPNVPGTPPNDCPAAIERSTNYLKGVGAEMDITKGLAAVYDRVFNSTQANSLVTQGRPFYLYNIGYANLFNGTQMLYILRFREQRTP